ncbi:hypothetical protein ACLGL1_02750 [Peptococcus simiae]|uniref:hypothetical protein n=1 Tax=Peptococcus simiae TaxID=1643805 RepID=UPI00397FED7F
MPEDKTTPVAEEQADQAAETKTEAPEDQAQQDEEKRFTQAEVDAKFVREIQKGLRDKLLGQLETGTGAVTATGRQATYPL